MAPSPLPGDLAGRRGPTLRAVGVGLGVIALVNVWVAWSEYIVHASRMNLSHFPLAFFVLFLLVIVGGRALGRVRFTSSELLTVAAMGLVGACIPASGLTGFLLGIIATPYYFATPENQWGTYFHDHIPAWIAPTDRDGAMQAFFNGLPPGTSVPWGVWVVPLCWWALFIGGIVLVSTSLAVLLRRQWAQHERLTYPLVAVTVDLVSGAEDHRGLLPPFARGGLFWAGFAVPFGIVSWNILTYFQPLLPAIPILGNWFTFARDFPSVHTRVNFFTMGFAYFAHPQVLFSIWVFFLLFVAEAGLLARFGYSIGSLEDQWSSYNAASSWQNCGAFLVLVLGGLYVGRRHLREAWRKALGLSSDADDRDEAMSYRAAIFGLLFGLVFLTAWLHAAGMEVRLALLFLTATFLIYLGIARIVAESGLIYVRTPLSAQSFASYLIGTVSLSPASLTALAFSYAIIANGRGLFMTALVHAVRLLDQIRADRRKVLLAIFGGLAAGVAISVALTISLGYTVGAYNFNDTPFSSLSQSVYRDTVGKMRGPFSTSWERLRFLGIGAAAMGLLTLFHYRLTWWPLHPIGFAISSNYLTRFSVFSIFIAWACKAALLRVGGVGLHRRSRPFFIGLITGHAVGVAVSFVVDWVWFPGQGHQIYSW
ncbi:MAG: hypothetical protein EXS64_20610 [Candidatus Latescibacteria bacterium]|nr:hypothetical protein [Candidatus Latescibacterota bacterium]